MMAAGEGRLSAEEYAVLSEESRELLRIENLYEVLVGRSPRRRRIATSKTLSRDLYPEFQTTEERIGKASGAGFAEIEDNGRFRPVWSGAHDRVSGFAESAATFDGAEIRDGEKHQTVERPVVIEVPLIQRILMRIVALFTARFGRQKDD